MITFETFFGKTAPVYHGNRRFAVRRLYIRNEISREDFIKFLVEDAEKNNIPLFRTGNYIEYTEAEKERYAARRTVPL